MLESLPDEYQFGGAEDLTWIEIKDGRLTICGGDHTVCDACIGGDCDSCKTIYCG